MIQEKLIALNVGGGGGGGDWGRRDFLDAVKQVAFLFYYDEVFPRFFNISLFLVKL